MLGNAPAEKDRQAQKPRASWWGLKKRMGAGRDASGKERSPGCADTPCAPGTFGGAFWFLLIPPVPFEIGRGQKPFCWLASGGWRKRRSPKFTRLDVSVCCAFILVGFPQCR